METRLPAETASADPARSLRDFALGELRRALSPPGTRLLALTTAAAGTAPPEGDTAFDLAWIAPESLEGIDLEALGRHVARAVRSGATVVCVVPGAWALPAMLQRALVGTGEPPGGWRERVEGRPAARASAGEWRRAFGAAFEWRAPRAIGVLVPTAPGWAERQPIVFGLLVAVEHLVAGWPILRVLGDRIVLEGVRR